jgi:CBS domain-containing protein
LNRFDEVTKIAVLNPVFAYEKDSIKDVSKKIVETHHRRIPIVDKKKNIVGIVTYMDILDFFLRNQSIDGIISDIMVRELIVCDYRDTIAFALQKLKLAKRGGMPILNKGKLVGIISEKDFIKFFSKEYNIKVSEVMTRKPLVIGPEFSILDSLKSMVNTKFRRLPVVDNKKLIGIITAADILRHLHSSNYLFDELDEPLDKILIKDVFTVSEDADLYEAAKIMISKDVSAVLVVNNKLEGILTERDIMREII